MKVMRKNSRDLRLIKLAAVILIGGIIIGILFAKIFENSYSSKLVDMYSSFFSNLDSASINKVQLLQLVVIRNFKSFFISLIICTTIAGIPYIVCYLLYKGFAVGFMLYFTIVQYKLKGIVFFLLYMFPQALVYVPVMMFLFLKGYSINKQLHNPAKSKGSIKKLLIEQIPNFIMLFILLLVGSFLEAYANSSILQKVLPLLFK